MFAMNDSEAVAVVHEIAAAFVGEMFVIVSKVVPVVLCEVAAASLDMAVMSPCGNGQVTLFCCCSLFLALAASMANMASISICKLLS